MILVTGATGNVGGALVRELAARGVGVRALVRDPARPLPQGVSAVTGDLNDPTSLGDALAGADGLFLMPGYDDGIAAEAARAGVGRIVLLSGGSVAGGDTSNAVAEYMIRSEASVRESGLPWTFLRPVSFMTNTFEWLPQLTDGDVVRAPFAEVAIATIDPADIAAVAAEALLSDGHEGQAYPLTGPEALLPADRLAVLGEVLDRRLTFQAEPDEEARARMLAAMPERYVDAFFSFFVDGTLDETTVRPTVAEVTGRPARTFRHWVEENAAAFAR
ncbi:NAD(P)H-binding protein [Microlunatus speluncae]|uniref:NAD(P)H-binding protein n=1 Tax=Microlunatus speluncae TaxID=2594267 RepID=UPI00126682EB|nr:NAD(P)H-binding protein [Microlunatus speluncae]